jgi:hypothetical protein
MTRSQQLSPLKQGSVNRIVLLSQHSYSIIPRISLLDSTHVTDKNVFDLNGNSRAMFLKQLKCVDIFLIFETCFIEFLPEIAVTA